MRSIDQTETLTVEVQMPQRNIDKLIEAESDCLKREAAENERIRQYELKWPLPCSSRDQKGEPVNKINQGLDFQDHTKQV